MGYGEGMTADHRATQAIVDRSGTLREARRQSLRGNAIRYSREPLSSLRLDRRGRSGAQGW